MTQGNYNKRTEQKKINFPSVLKIQLQTTIYHSGLCFSWGWLLIELQFSRTFWMMMATMDGGGVGVARAISLRVGGWGWGWEVMTYKERAACCGWALVGWAAGLQLSIHSASLGLWASNLFSLPQLLGCKMGWIMLTGLPGALYEWRHAVCLMPGT